MPDNDEKKKIINRLRTIKGHIQGIENMIESEKGCDEIMVQIAAVKQSIHKVGLAVMEAHASECMLDDEKMDKNKVEEMIKMIFNYSK